MQSRARTHTRSVRASARRQPWLHTAARARHSQLLTAASFPPRSRQLAAVECDLRGGVSEQLHREGDTPRGAASLRSRPSGRWYAGIRPLEAGMGGGATPGREAASPHRLVYTLGTRTPVTLHRRRTLGCWPCMCVCTCASVRARVCVSGGGGHYKPAGFAKLFMAGARTSCVCVCAAV